MRSKPIYVETAIKTDIAALWNCTQTPELHQKWDLRFSEISYLPRQNEAEPQKFLYRTRIGFGLAISGTGETNSSIQAATGERISTLRFGSEQPVSLIRRGGGYWKYSPNGDTVTFMTQYDYDTRFGAAGRLVDRYLFRPLFGYATAWSFDMLRLWLEKQIPPAVSKQRAFIHYFSVGMIAALWSYEGLVPKLLYPEAGEAAIWRATGWFPGAEIAWLQLLGIAEIGAGLLSIAFHRSRRLYLAQIVLLLLLAAAALVANPELLRSPFNPATLSFSIVGFCLFAMCTTTDLPRAGRCLRKPAQYVKGDESSGIDL
jgi:hypothetical protein